MWVRRPGSTGDFTIVGVAPKEFGGTELFYGPEVYIPMAMALEIEPGSKWLESRTAENLFLIGRLKNGLGWGRWRRDSTSY